MPKPKSMITEYRSYYLAPSFPLLLLSGPHWKISDIPSGRLHFHNCLEIGIVHSGSGTLKFSEQSFNFKTGDVTIIPRNVSHTTYSTPGTQSHWSYLFLDTKELFRKLSPLLLKNQDLSMDYSAHYQHILHQKDYPDIHHFITLLIRELLEQKTNYQLSVQGLLLSLCIELCRIQSKQDATLRDPKTYKTPDNALIIAPALDYIEDHYMKPLPINQLSDLCHWSPTHFRRVFNEIIGTAPLDFINNTRIIKSCNLLRHTQESILNISEMVGFRSVSSYNRCFLKLIGITPREYRKQNLPAHMNAKHPAILEYAGWMSPEK